MTARYGWMFVIQDGRIGLKINDQWADDELLAYNETPEGAAEIERQWLEYARRGSPFLSYQPLTAGVVR